ncbi:MAG TPA: flagellar assembly protein FliW [Acidimicrobiales bacterium]|nr:flagellar assembly protein FliW [Acidimicrobiales bacterium]
MLITRDRAEEPEVGAERSPAQESSAGRGDDSLDGAVVDFAGGLPGFPALRKFRLEVLAPDLQPFCQMRSVEESGICFTLVAPGALFPDYKIEIDEQHVASLGLESADDALVLAIVTLGEPPTANLLGPLVVNRHSRAAAQVVQYLSSHRAAEPLTPRSA